MPSEARANAGDIDSYAVQKAATYTQSDTSGPVFQDAGGFIAVNEDSTGSVPPTPTIKDPTGATTSMTLFGTQWSVGDDEGTLAALQADPAWQSGGNFKFTIPTLNAPNTTFTPTLVEVPMVLVAPNIGNTTWNAGDGNLVFNGNVSNTLTWNTNDGTFYDFVMQGSLGDFISITGNASDLSLVLPVGTFGVGETYNGYLAFRNETDDFSQVPGAVGQAMSYSQTYFGIDVVPEPSTDALLVGGLGILRIVVQRRKFRRVIS